MSRRIGLVAGLVLATWAVSAAAQEAVVETPQGSFVIRLLPDIAPLHVKHFVKTARAGGFDGTTFHRVIAHAIIQGGDPLSKDPKKAALYGLTPYQVGAALNTQITGYAPTVFRTAGKEYDMVVRLRPDQRAKPSDIENLTINGPMGPVPLKNLTTARTGTGPLDKALLSVRMAHGKEDWK
jgi:hypothetical protein